MKTPLLVIPSAFLLYRVLGNAMIRTVVFYATLTTIMDGGRRIPVFATVHEDVVRCRRILAFSLHGLVEAKTASMHVVAASGNAAFLHQSTGTLAQAACLRDTPIPIQRVGSARWEVLTEGDYHPSDCD